MDAPAQMLNDLRAKVLAGQEVTDEEYKLVIDALRSDRRTAARSAKEPSKPSRLPKENLLDLIKRPVKQ